MHPLSSARHPRLQARVALPVGVKVRRVEKFKPAARLASYHLWLSSFPAFPPNCIVPNENFDAGVPSAAVKDGGLIVSLRI
jgi:hypothetical protein